MNNSLRQEYLNVIGIRSWRLKSALEDNFTEPEIVQEPQSYIEPQLYKEPQPYEKPHDVSFESQQTADIESKEVSVYKAVDNNELSSSNIISQNKTAAIPVTDEKSVKINDKVTLDYQPDSDTYIDLKQKIIHCKKCPSRNTRLNAIIGQGNGRASVFIIGGAPNAEEDRLGTYLVDQSGILFQAMLKSIELEDNYFFTGLIKCYSMADFRFSEQDRLNCIPYLYSQIEQINPSILLVLGAAEAQALLNTKQSFNELRGKVHHTTINNKDYSVIISYHPAYLLRNPVYKKESLKDLIMVKNLLK